MGQVELKVARATDEEIDRVTNVLNEMAALDRYYGYKYYYDAISENTEEFTELSKICTGDRDYFIDGLFRLINNMRYEVVLFNLRVLMDNCAKLDSDILEFNDQIREAMALLEVKKESEKA